MPSGSRGGSSHSSSGRSGGGSHSSFGRSGGGFSSSPSRSSSSSYRSTPSHNTTIVVGGGGYRHGYRRRRYYSSGSPMSIMGIICVIALIAAIIGVTMMSGANAKLKNMQVDYDYYTDMVRTAKADTTNSHTRSAIVTDWYKDTKGEKYFVYYEFEVEDGSGDKMEGISFSVYTLQQAQAIKGTTIEIAIYTPGVTLTPTTGVTWDTDSVPMAYGATRLEDDGVYVAVKSDKSLGTTILGVGGALFVLLILAQVGFFSFLRSRPVANTNSTSNPSAPTSSAPSAGASNSASKFCSYCGAKIGPNDSKCPNCGGVVTQ